VSNKLHCSGSITVKNTAFDIHLLGSWVSPAPLLDMVAKTGPCYAHTDIVGYLMTSVGHGLI
jgi:hypothetical protein